jgi:hypothetical protein
MVLNILSLPLGYEYRSLSPYEFAFYSYTQFIHSRTIRHFNSHANAWQRTRQSPIFSKDAVPPIDELVWATTATKNATSFLHIDANGLGTIVDSVAGTKYWVIGKRRRENTLPGSPGDMSSMHWMGESDIDTAKTDCFEHEAVVIEPGTIL